MSSSGARESVSICKAIISSRSDDTENLLDRVPGWNVLHGLMSFGEELDPTFPMLDHMLGD
jgi:hypothetical protein